MKSTRAGWIAKFRFAFDGFFLSVRTQPSFWVHLTLTTAVIALAACLRVEPWRWSVLFIVISLVLTAELLNTALEQVISVVHPEHHERIGQGLDAAAAAVLVAAIGAVAVGLVTLGPPVWQWIAS